MTENSRTPHNRASHRRGSRLRAENRARGFSTEVRGVPGSGLTLVVEGEAPVEGTPEILVLEPPAGTVTAENEIEVSGTLGGFVDSVTVNGVAASFDLETFVARVPLPEGTSLLVGTASNRAGESASDSLSVRRDATPPLVVIETPSDGDRLVGDVVTVAGTVNDIIPGATVNADDVSVEVNGLPAAVDNRTFLFPDLPLVPGPNRITVTAVDRAGNEGTASIEVVHVPELFGVRVEIVGGNNQVGPIGTRLPSPLAARLTDQDGRPLANRPVEFTVSRGDGLLGPADDPRRTVTVLTDADGEATVEAALGSRTGEGFHRVRASSPGSPVFAEFCATAVHTDPRVISVHQPPRSRGLTGQPLTDPLSVIVTDESGNAVPGVPVTFRVERGGGSFSGFSVRVVATDFDGIAEAVWTLGSEPGRGNQEVSATFEGNPGLPAFFVVSAVQPGPVEETRVSGLVQDSVGGAIEGARVVLRGTDLEAFTGADGAFTLVNVAPGGHRVGILGSSAPRLDATFPDIEFAVEAFAGVDNALDQVVVLPFLDMANAKLVGGAEDVVLEMEGVAGFAIKVFANSVILPDGTRGEVLMSSSQVKADKLPMVPPRGGTPLVVGTLQPAGIRFDPPAQVIYPNAAALAPGDVADIFAFHHDVGQFVNIGPGTVTADGGLIVSDPGFGIVQSGWHCIVRLPGETGQCKNDCDATLSWRYLKADGSLDETRTDAPIRLFLNVPDARRALVDVDFDPGDGGFQPETRWDDGDSTAVGLSGEIVEGSLAQVILTGISVGSTRLRSPVYEFNETTCEAEVGVRVSLCDGAPSGPPTVKKRECERGEDLPHTDRACEAEDIRIDNKEKEFGLTTAEQLDPQITACPSGGESEWCAVLTELIGIYSVQANLPLWNGVRVMELSNTNRSNFECQVSDLVCGSRGFGARTGDDPLRNCYPACSPEAWWMNSATIAHELAHVEKIEPSLDELIFDAIIRIEEICTAATTQSEAIEIIRNKTDFIIAVAALRNSWVAKLDESVAGDHGSPFGTGDAFKRSQEITDLKAIEICSIAASQNWKTTAKFEEYCSIAGEQNLNPDAQE